MIDLTNRTNLILFVQDNIVEYNADRRPFTAKNLQDEIKNQLNIDEDPEITDSEIGVYLTERLAAILSDPALKSALDNQLNQLSGPKYAITANLRSIADNEILAFTDLEKYYESMLMSRIQITYESSQQYRKDVLERLLDYSNYAVQMNQNNSDQINYIRNDLKKAVDKALYLALAGGFTNNSINDNTGTKAANDGDSAQFLFLARAILAGFNCSNVDVRSSKYDAVIDYDGHLLRVQVKGISDSKVYFRNRPRGGAGINPNARRNQGSVISPQDSDIYVAVDKQFGICYIIPTIDIATWIQSGIDSMIVSQLYDYKENWDKISFVSQQVFGP